MTSNRPSWAARSATLHYGIKNWLVFPEAHRKVRAHSVGLGLRRNDYEAVFVCSGKKALQKLGLAELGKTILPGEFRLLKKVPTAVFVSTGKTVEDSYHVSNLMAVDLSRLPESARQKKRRIRR